jgi:guanylate kinase
MADLPEPLDTGELVIVLIGASAVGKSTIAEYLSEAGIVQPTPTWATRPPRDGEKDTCYDHRFVSGEEFDRQERKGDFIDQHTFYGARYGVPPLTKPPEGREALVVLKPVFVPEFVKHYPHTRIYQIEASTEKLSARMYARGQSIEDIGERMRLHPEEAEDARRYAHVIFTNNGPVEVALQQVEAQIRADREAYDAERPPRASSAG